MRSRVPSCVQISANSRARLFKELIQTLSAIEKAASLCEANRLILNGGSCGVRTCDSLLKRQILYLLS